MQQKKIGIIHPGEMGSFVAASALKSGQAVFWAADGRSAATRDRAAKLKFADAGSLTDLCEKCAMIFSVCPPHAAETVAEQVIKIGFKGLYLDANAISPQRVQRISQKLSAAGIQFVDGGIIGLPDWETGNTWLYLSGEHAADVADCFSGGLLKARVIGDQPGKASALKMCYAANTKGTTALICAVNAAAEALGVREELQRQWSMEGTALAESAPNIIRRVTAKAWRFSGEMEEISSTFASAGIPGEFHAAAAEIYRRISGFKDTAGVPALDDVLAALKK